MVYESQTGVDKSAAKVDKSTVAVYGSQTDVDKSAVVTDKSAAVAAGSVQEQVNFQYFCCTVGDSLKAADKLPVVSVKCPAVANESPQIKN